MESNATTLELSNLSNGNAEKKNFGVVFYPFNHTELGFRIMN